MRDQIVFYAHPGFADWEASFILPVLKEKKRNLLIVSEQGKALESMGGLTIIPDTRVNRLDPGSISCLILPGGESWNDPERNSEILDVANELFSGEDAVVAAICAATVGLARIGVLDHKRHTSNDLDLLKHLVPSYRGEEFYRKDLAFTDGNLITASGVGAIEFALEIMKTLDVYDEARRQDWFNLFKKAVAPPPNYWQVQ